MGAVVSLLFGVIGTTIGGTIANFATIAILILLVYILWETVFEPRVKAFFKKYLIEPVTGLFDKLKISDERLKENISRVGVTSQGIPVYEFNYTFDDEKRIYTGVLAQDLVGTEYEEECVVRDESGIYKVDYGALNMTYNKRQLPF